MGSTRTATFVFTDLVGSTALASSLGPDQAEELRQVHFGLLRGAVAACGGVEVKNLGDGLMVMFPSTTRALACAVGMQQAIERHNRRAPVALSVRVGVSMGEAVEEDGDFFGDPVVEAARLCAAAQGGQVLTTELVRALVGRHAAQEFAVVGDLDLKGLPEPVPAVAVLWEPETEDDTAADDVPLPARLVVPADHGLFAFFGRATELDALASVAKRAFTEARAHAVMLSGEPGIGKTSVAAHAAREAHAAGATVLFGSCEDGLAVPYQAWMSALGHLVAHVADDVLALLTPVQAGMVRRLVPNLAARLPQGETVASDPDSERFLLLEAVVSLIAAAAGDRGLVIVLDDLHWADAATVQMLRHLMTSDAALRVVVLGTYRSTDLPRGHPLASLLADLRADARVSRVDLRGLDRSDITDLISAAAGYDTGEAGDHLAAVLHRETDGNPFFVTELIRHLGQSAAIAEPSAPAQALPAHGLELPGSVREVIVSRVERLGEEPLRVLSLAAVVGREFDADVLGAVAGVGTDELLDLLDAACTAGVVAESGTSVGAYRFAHALVQHTLYAELSAARRHRTHQLVAEALEARAPGAGRTAELARHWIAATRPSDAAKAVRYARAAGEEALAALAPWDAAEWFSQALELMERQPGVDEVEQASVLIRLAIAKQQAGQPFTEAFVAARRAAVRLADPELLATVALAPIFVEAPMTGETASREFVEHALAAAGDDHRNRARLLAALLDTIDFRDWDRRREAGRAALEAAEQSDDDVAHLQVLLSTFMSGSAPQDLRRRQTAMGTAIELADRVGDPVQAVAARSLATWALAEAGEFDAVARHVDEMEAIAERTRLPATLYNTLPGRAFVLLERGDTTGAEEVVEQLRVLTETTDHLIVGYLASLYYIRRHQGRMEELVDIVMSGLTRYPGIDAFRLNLMRALIASGRGDEAAAAFEAEAERGFDFPLDAMWLMSTSYCAETAVDLRDERASSVLYERLRPFAGRMVSSSGGMEGSVDAILGRLANVLGMSDAAEGHFVAAHELHRRQRLPYWTARALLHHAESCRDAARAAAMVADASEIAERHGYAGLVKLADQLR